MGAVYKREMKAYISNVYGFLFIAALLFVPGVLVFILNLNYGLADMTYAFLYEGYTSFVLILMIPLLCMRIMAEDKRNKTDLFYLSLPLRTSTVVLGKYLALLTVLAVPTLILALYPIILSVFGNMNFLRTYSTLLMYFLMGAAFLAVCMFLSSLTKHMALAALYGVLAGVALYFLPPLANLLPYTALASLLGLYLLALVLTVISWFATKNLTVVAIVAAVGILPLTLFYILDAFVFHWEAFPGLFPLIVDSVSPFCQFERVVMDGNFDLFAVSTMISTAVFFVYLTVRSADNRRLA